MGLYGVCRQELPTPFLQSLTTTHQTVQIVPNFLTSRGSQVRVLHCPPLFTTKPRFLQVTGNGSVQVYLRFTVGPLAATWRTSLLAESYVKLKKEGALIHANHYSVPKL
jgi:hypothetical protein